MFAQAATVASLIVLTRLVAKPTLGGYQQLWLIYGILAPFLVGGIPSSLLYFLPRAADRDEERKWVLDSYLVLAALGLASSVVVVLLRDPIAAAMSNPELSRAVLVYAPYPLFAFLSAAMPPALIAVGRIRLASVLNGVNAASTVAIVVAAALVSPTTVSLAAGLSISGCVAALFSTAGLARAFGLGGLTARRAVAWRALLTYGLPLALTGFAGRLGYQFDRLVVSNRFAPGDYAIYAVGAVEVPIAIVVQQSVNSVLVPALSRLHAAGDVAGLARQWRAAIRKTSLVLLPLFAFLMLMADSVVHVLFGPTFDRSAPIFRAYLFMLPLRMASYGLLPQAAGRTRVNLVASVIQLAANVVFAVALVVPFGLLGPAMSTPLASAVVAVYFLVRLRSIVALSFAQLMPWRLLAVNLGISFLAAAPLLLLFTLSMSPFARLAAACALFLPAYALLLRVTGRLTPTEWQLLRGMLPNRAKWLLPA